MTEINPLAGQWDDRYRQPDYFYGTEPNDFLASVAHRIPMGSVLCVADGEGRNSTFLSTLGYEVSSIDISAVGVEKTRQLAEFRNVHVDAHIGDLATFDIGVRKWEGIVSIFCHLPHDLRRDLHRRIVSSLVPGGVVILEAYTPDQIGRGTGGPQLPELLMTASALREEFEELEILHLEELIRDVVEGSGHSGEAAVVQLIARKK